MGRKKIGSIEEILNQIPNVDLIKFISHTGLEETPIDHPYGDEHYIGWAFSIGPGASWTELKNWSEMKGIKITPWEAETLHILSQKMRYFLDSKELQNPYGMTEEDIKVKYERLKGKQDGMGHSSTGA